MTETTTIFTMAQFVMIGVFAAIVIFGIIFGMRMKRRRISAEAEVEAHRDAVEDAADAPDAPAQASSPPVTPAPPAPRAVEPEARAATPPAEPTAEIAQPLPEPIAPPAQAAAPQPEERAADSAIPTPAATPAPVAPTPLAGDITQLKGLGPKLAATLAQLGITRVDQIAAMSPAQLADLDTRLGAFRGRPARDRWAEQAALLVAGDKAAYEAEFGKLG